MTATPGCRIGTPSLHLHDRRVTVVERRTHHHGSRPCCHCIWARVHQLLGPCCNIHMRHNTIFLHAAALPAAPDEWWGRDLWQLVACPMAGNRCPLRLGLMSDEKQSSPSGARPPPPDGLEHHQPSEIRQQPVKHMHNCGKRSPQHAAAPFAPCCELCPTGQSALPLPQLLCLPSAHNQSSCGNAHASTITKLFQK